MVKYLTIAEIAEQADIPNSTCRRYLAAFEPFFLVKGGNRVKKYEATSVDVLKRIKQLYDEGQDTNEIHNVLVNEFPMVIDSDKQQESNEQVTVPGLATSEDIAVIREELQEIKAFNAHLLQEMKNQHLYYEKKFEELKHDRELVHSLRGSMEQRKLESSDHESKTNHQLENINKQISDLQQSEQLHHIEKQLFEIQQKQNEHGTVTEQFAELHNQLNQVLKETATKKEKKGFWAKVLGK